jgi:hypothetical protein
MAKYLRHAFVFSAIFFVTTPNLGARWRVRITTLGGTPHSFSQPLTQPDDLRRMIVSHMDDVRTVLKKKGSGWTGRFEDLETAVKFADVKVLTIPVGARLPWMAMRRSSGRPALYKPLDGMIWAGSAPLDAYYIAFRSNGKGWKLIVPKPCGNFWITSEPLTQKFIDSELRPKGDCFHEDQEIQFAPSGSAYNREGLIMHDNGDFGDTAQREGWYWLGVWIRANELHQPWTDSPARTLDFDAVERKLEPEQNGIFVRAPGKNSFGLNTDGNENHGMTRDQLVPVIAALGVRGKQDILQRLWYALPEDVLGKHDFQGHWHDNTNGRDFYTSDPVNDIKNRVCALSVDARDCSLNVDTRNCGHDVWGIHYNDPFCEIAKGTQNALYVAQKLVCEASKATQNALYLAAQVACNVQKGVDVAYATFKKETFLLRFSGDPLQPMTYKLLVRSGVVPISIFPATQLAVAIGLSGGGDLNLLGSIAVLRNQATGDLDGHCQYGRRDCVDQDMNSVVMLWMFRHTGPTLGNASAIQSYKSRDHSYGSYFKRYCEVYGPLRIYPGQSCPEWEPDCSTDKPSLDAKVVARMNAGIASGWPPDARGSGPYGAIRWYNRWSTKANPKLATLWEPIFDNLLK